MTAVEAIIQTVQEATGITPVVKGGNRRNPIEYFYSRTGEFTFRLELHVHGNDLLDVQSMADTIITAINDFGDSPQFKYASVDINGGGSYTKEDIITQTMYFDVIDKGVSVSPPAKRPTGTYSITDNGLYDITNYESVSVQVGNPDEYKHYFNFFKLGVRNTDVGIESNNDMFDGDSRVYINATGWLSDRCRIGNDITQNYLRGKTIEIGMFKYDKHYGQHDPNAIVIRYWLAGGQIDYLFKDDFSEGSETFPESEGLSILFEVPETCESVELMWVGGTHSAVESTGYLDLSRVYCVIPDERF